jgi:predicted methyltransferase
VIEQAQKAGFTLVAKSEINANPKDTKDHPFGVWTLPPALRSTPYGSSERDPGFDHSRYLAIGESDRMTLKFVRN